MNSELQQQLLRQSLQFETLLRSELQALQDRAPAGELQQLAEQKMDASQNLEALERSFKQQGHTDIGDSCLQCLQRCRELNERIGLLLRRQADYNQQAMEVLGISQPSLRTYSAAGTAADTPARRHLGEA